MTVTCVSANHFSPRDNDVILGRLPTNERMLCTDAVCRRRINSSRVTSYSSIVVGSLQPSDWLVFMGDITFQGSDWSVSLDGLESVGRRKFVGFHELVVWNMKHEIRRYVFTAS